MQSTGESKGSSHSSKQIDLLLEEWKGNVSLYIDQDKRGFDRIKMFLAIHGGLLVFYKFMFSTMSITLFVAVIGIVITAATWAMSNRAHAFILLRKFQGMLIEHKIKSLAENNGNDLGISPSNVLSTFSHEHTAFSPMPSERQCLRNELRGCVDEKALDTFDRLGSGSLSIGHLDWLQCMYSIIIMLWIFLFFAPLI